MSESQLTDMNYTDFQDLMTAYIDRSAHRDDALPASTFLALLFDTLSQRAHNVVRLEGEIVNGRLVLTSPEETPVQVRGNQIFVDDWQVVVTLKKGSLVPA